MGLNKSNGNMYEWVTHTWNTVKGKCPHDCSYCYMKRWGHLKDVRLEENELKTDLGSGNFIFVGSSCDMFADNIPGDWIIKTLEHCAKYPDNKYLFQSKNPEAFHGYGVWLAELDLVLCTTIESNRFYDDIMKNSPDVDRRAEAMGKLADATVKTYVTIEPVMDFDRFELEELIRQCQPVQVNIGADSGGHDLPEPSKEKLLELIFVLERFTTVKQKKNLQRLLK